MLSRSTTLKPDISKKIVNERLERLKEMLDMSAPEVILLATAEHWLRCYKISWKETWNMIKIRHFPHWALWLTDRTYRHICREDPPEFGEMGELFIMPAPICEPQKED